MVAQQPVAQAAHRQVADRGESAGVMRVDDQPGDFVAFVGNHRFEQKLLERHVGQGHLRGGALGVAGGGDARQAVAGAQRASFGQDFAQAVEAPGLATDAVGIGCHGQAPVSGWKQPGEHGCR